MTTITTQGAPAAVPTAQVTGSGTDIAADFSTFLTLLTTQLRNQDPLNPMNSTEFATQLATFSGVEQQVRTNEHLETLLSRTGVTTLAQLGEWVGMEVLTEAPVNFSGVPVRLHGTAEALAEEAQLVVKTAAGAEVQRLSVPLPVSELTWAGVDGQGAPLPAGEYQFELQSLRQGSVIGTAKMRHHAQVVEVRPNGQAVELHLVGGQVVAADAVTGLRRPGL